MLLEQAGWADLHHWLSKNLRCKKKGLQENFVGVPFRDFSPELHLCIYEHHALEFDSASAQIPCTDMAFCSLPKSYELSLCVSSIVFSVHSQTLYWEACFPLKKMVQKSVL